MSAIRGFIRGFFGRPKGPEYAPDSRVRCLETGEVRVTESGDIRVLENE